MTAFSLLFVAPICQIVFLTLKIKDLVRLPDGLVAVFTFILGIALTILGWNLVEADVHPDPGPKCEIIPTAFVFVGLFVTIVLTPLIELAFFIVKKLIKRKSPPIAQNRCIRVFSSVHYRYRQLPFFPDFADFTDFRTTLNSTPAAHSST